MDYRTLVLEDLRLVLLRLLREAGGHRANSSVLQAAAEAVGHTVTRAQVETELGYLEGHGAVTLERLDGIVIALLAQRGEDHVLRRARIAGVKPPALS